jgi:hypothetical protein
VKYCGRRRRRGYEGVGGEEEEDMREMKKE